MLRAEMNFHFAIQSNAYSKNHTDIITHACVVTYCNKKRAVQNTIIATSSVCSR